jgi:hypothetical protein
LDSLSGWLTKALGSAEHADALAALYQRVEVAPSDIVARQGEPSDSMHFILEAASASSSTWVTAMRCACAVSVATLSSARWD